MAHEKFDATTQKGYIELLNDIMESYDAQTQANLKAKIGADLHKIHPGFFTPYRNVSEFGYGLVAPIVAPTVLGLVAGAAAFAAGVGTLASITSLLFSAGSAIIGSANKDFENAETGVFIAALAGVAAAVAVVAAAAFTVAAAALLPLALLAFVTRSITTTFTVATEYFSGCSHKNDEEYNQEEESSGIPTM